MTRIIIPTFWIGVGAMVCHVGALSEQQQLDKNRGKWNSFIGSGAAGYSMKFTHECFCPPEYCGPFLVAVNSMAKVASACYLEGSEFAGTCVKDQSTMLVITVEDAFDQVQRALNEGVNVFEVMYDKDGGYPSDVYIDWSDATVDEETSFKISSVVPL